MTEFQKRTPAKQKNSQSLSKGQELEQRLYACKASRIVPLEEAEITETLSKAKEAFYEGAKLHTVSRMEFLFNQMSS